MEEGRIRHPNIRTETNIGIALGFKGVITKTLTNFTYPLSSHHVGAPRKSTAAVYPDQLPTMLDPESPSFNLCMMYLESRLPPAMEK
jgi:hypothetical protein